uniref:Ion_trans_2 domain-containing protein n=1 Tax=Haemonchus contortus TaxID=6289 RepID=A0A7I4YZY3_HAECO
MSKEGARSYPSKNSAEGRYPYPIKSSAEGPYPLRRGEDGAAKSYPGKRVYPTSRSSEGVRYASIRRKSSAVVDERQWTLKTKLRPFLRATLFINIMILISLVFFWIFYAVGKKSEHLDFEIRKTPHTLGFDNVSVVTNSDSCNEVARVFLSQGLSMFAMAFSMQLCLMAYEFHRSGLGGSSAYAHLDAVEGKCTTLNTFGAADRVFEEYLMRKKKEVNMEQQHNTTAGWKQQESCFSLRFGKEFTSVVEIPGEIVTLRSLFKRIPVEEREPTIRLIKLYVFRVLTKSSSLRTVEEANKDELEFLSVLRFANDKTEIRQILEEALSAGLDWNFLYALMAKRFEPRCVKNETEGKYYNHFKNSQDNAADYVRESWKKFESHEEIRTLSLNDSICISKNVELSIPKEVLNQGGIVSQNGSYFNNLWANTLMILHYIEKFSYNIYEKSSESFKEHYRLTLRGTKTEAEAQYQTSGGGATGQTREPWRRVGNKYQWASNMFVIVNKTSQSALAYTGTLGSQFGSGAVSGLGPLNDLGVFKSLAAGYGQYEYAIHKLFPMISKKGKAIKFAYSNIGGSTAVSRALPRLFYVMTLGGLSVPLEKILVSPMAFPRVSDDSPEGDGSAHKGIIYLDGIDFLLNIPVIQQQRLDRSQPDESVAIEIRGNRVFATHADASKDISFMPTGI